MLKEGVNRTKEKVTNIKNAKRVVNFPKRKTRSQNLTEKWRTVPQGATTCKYRKLLCNNAQAEKRCNNVRKSRESNAQKTSCHYKVQLTVLTAPKNRARLIA